MAEGAFVSFLAKAKPGIFPSVAQVQGPPTTAKFPGSVDEFVAAQRDTADADTVARMMRNRIKKCTACQKPNAFTLDTCNGCGSSLAELPISFSPNVFMGFVFGVQKCPFPLTVSVRKQTDAFLVMDDLLAISPLHFNVIPTRVYIPDWRYLLRRPAEGLALMREMRAMCCAAAAETHLANTAWVQKVASGPCGTDPISVEHLMSGFNYPPSQYQLHLQFFSPVLLPFQHAQFLRAVHFTFKRFFPFEYVAACLSAAVAAAAEGGGGGGLPAALLADDADIEAVIDYFATERGVHYATFHQQSMAVFAALARRFSSWQMEDFEGIVVGTPAGDVFCRSAGAGAGNAPLALSTLAADASAALVDPKVLVEQDKLALQNYGRPYGSDGRPQGQYYAFPKAVADIAAW